MRKFSIIIPTYHTPELIQILIQTFERFKPVDVENHFIIVENSDDESYKDLVLSMAKFVTWIQNPDAPAFGSSNNSGSFANGMAVKKGLEGVNDEYVFVAHCDVCLTSTAFFEEMFKKRQEGYSLIGTSIDNSRINAIHQSGFYIRTELLKKCDIMPVFENGKVVQDVCDPLTAYCRKNNLPVFCYKNTFNDPALVNILPEPYKSFHVDRCLDSDGSIMFMHLGRGVPKTTNTYFKPNRVYLPQWCEFAQEYLR